MFLFRYIKKNDDGSTQEGQLFAEDKDAAMTELNSLGITIESLWRDEEVPPGASGNLSAEQSEVISGQIAQIVEQDLPLEASLRAMSSEADSHSVRSTLRYLSNQLAAGADPLELIERSKNRLPRRFQQVLLTGLKTKQLGPLLREYSNFEHARLARSRKIWLAMIYPIILLTSAITLIFFLMSTVIPRFREMFEEFGTELPAITELLVDASLVFESWGSGLALIVLLSVLGYVSQRILLPPENQFRVSKFFSVIFGIDKSVAAANYCQILALFVEKNLPLPIAISLAADCVGDNRTIQQWMPTLESHVNATGASEIPEKLEPRLRSAFRWKDNQEAFTSMLRANAESLSIQTDMKINRVVMLTEPVLYCAILCTCGFIVTGLFMPLIRLLNALS